MRRFVILLATLILTPLTALAQDDGESVEIGQWRTIESEILGESRRVIVVTPDGYDESDDNYGVIYLLDGPFHVLHTAGAVQFMADQDDMPPMIIVAIANTDRTRDLTPPTSEHSANFSTAGGADNFITFLRDELAPFIDDNYRTRDYRMLIGHSFGGLFAIHTLVHEPAFFNAYIAISPSLQWDDQALVAQAEAFFEETDELNASLYMTIGNEGSDMLGGVRKVQAALAEHQPKGFEWDSRVMEEESHGTVPLRSTRQGLAFIFKDWPLRDPTSLYQLGGLEAIHDHYRTTGEKFGVERAAPWRTIMETALTLAFDGEIEAAFDVLLADTETYPPYPRALMYLADACMEHDDTANAIRCYEMVLEFEPDHEGARAALTDLGVEPPPLTDAPTTEN